jgi:hypothetical protein
LTAGLQPADALARQRTGPRMHRFARIMIMMGACLIAAPVLAQQAPLSPIFRTTPNTSEPAAASNAVAVAPVPPATKPAPTVARWDDPAVATAEIPPAVTTAPPPTAAPPRTVKRQKRPTLEPPYEEAAAQLPAAKSQKRAAAPRRYARRHHVRRYARYYGPWNYGYATAAVTGWGGGRFGPSPYSSNTQ